MSKSRLLITFVLLMWFASALNAQTAGPALVPLEVRAPSVVQFEYDPFSGLPSSESFSVEVHNLSPGDSDFDELAQQQAILSIQPLDAASFNLVGQTLQLPVELVSNNQPSFTRVEQGYAGAILLSPEDSPSSVSEFTINLPESLYADAGGYTLDLEISLLDALSNEPIVASRLMTVEVSVVQKLQTNIAGTKGRYEDGANFAVIDFGELQTGEEQQVFIQVRGNTDANITVSSENNGKMLNKENPKLYVDYTVDVDGQVSDLEAPLVLARTLAKDLQGSAYPMKVTIGNVSKSFSGIYQDIISVDVSPQ